MKKYLLGVVAVVLAITFSAFSKTVSPKTLAGEKWFQLAPGGNPNEPSDYSLLGNGSTAPSCTGVNVCAKLAIPDSQNEDIPNLGTTIDTRFRSNP
jgi:hypothetical protein